MKAFSRYRGLVRLCGAMLIVLGLWAAGTVPAICAAAAIPPHKTRTVVLIVSDGLRWQEIFTGAEEGLLNDKEGGSWVPTEDLRKRYWRASRAGAARAALPVPMGNRRQAGADLRQPGDRQRRARDQRQGILLSGVQRDEHGLSQRCHRQQRIRRQPQRERVRMAEQVRRIQGPGGGLRHLECLHEDIQPNAQRPGDPGGLDAEQAGPRDPARCAAPRTLRHDHRIRRGGRAQLLPADSAPRLREIGRSAGAVRRLRRDRQLGPPGTL